ncbi:MAG TPA: hypothetical protein VLN73_09395 [Alphaproteobacteria bacterium]|nr:hypothetical protein [Alphaproteobacteria bacterium]
MARLRRNKAKTGTRGHGPVYWGLVIFAALALGMVFALPTVLVIGIGLLPTFAALLVDVHPKKYAAWSVGLLNCSGLMPYLGDLWASANSMDGAITIVSDLVAWLVIYSAAGVGWLIYMAMPAMGSVIMDIKANRRIRRLKAEKQALMEEWGETVAGEGEAR